MSRKLCGSHCFLSIVFTTVMWIAMCCSSFSSGGEKPKNLPARGISVSPEYTGVIAYQGEDVNIELIVTNRGRRDENINLTLTSVPQKWTAWIKTYNFGVTGVHVKSDESKNLTLRVEPDEDVAPGKYTFGIKAQTQDRKIASSSQVIITVKEKKEEHKAEGVNIVTSYPVLRGPTDAMFEFSLDVENKSDKDGIFNLTSEGPENWEINFKPAYEDKFISSLRLKATQSQTVAVNVKPYPLAPPAQYPIAVKVSSQDAEGEVSLSVVLTGTYSLDVVTANGLLSLNALRGENANISLYIKNSGSAILNNIQFLSFKPENWKIEFSPGKIDALAPQELEQVEVSITPSGQALVGDYSVGLSAKAGDPPKADKNIELRVTVRASAAWSWIGIGIIVLVLTGLVVLFVRLGRR